MRNSLISSTSKRLLPVASFKSKQVPDANKLTFVAKPINYIHRSSVSHTKFKNTCFNKLSNIRYMHLPPPQYFHFISFEVNHFINTKNRPT